MTVQNSVFYTKIIWEKVARIDNIMAPNEVKIELHRLRVVPIHKHPEYMKPCCSVINEEWPRSETARMHSLKVSGDQLPTSLVLVLKDDVIGHCKLSRIPSIPDSCFLETVVIRKNLRGLKLGTYFMSKVEQYCKNYLKLSYVHLSTTDKEIFYKKLGYSECEPISIFGGPCYLPFNSKVDENTQTTSATLSFVNRPGPPPPPPPPIPTATSQHSSDHRKNKVFMKKKL